MCGRYNIEPDALALLDAYEILGDIIRQIQPRRNVYPGSDIPVIIRGNKLLYARWGFVPSWADHWTGPKPINARSESILKGMWRGARRCLVPMSGFFEPGKPAMSKWQAGERKRYFYFSESDNLPLFAAGLCSGGDKPSVAIITVGANQTVADCRHNRMPALLVGEEPDIWLSSQHKLAELRELLRPADVELLLAMEVDGLNS